MDQAVVVITLEDISKKLNGFGRCIDSCIIFRLVLIDCFGWCQEVYRLIRVESSRILFQKISQKCRTWSPTEKDDFYIAAYLHHQGRSKALANEAVFLNTMHCGSSQHFMANLSWERQQVRFTEHIEHKVGPELTSTVSVGDKHVYNQSSVQPQLWALPK